MNLIKNAFLLLLIIAPSFVKAQKPLFRHFTTNEGLPTTETYHVFQDSKGYIWITSDNGVSRYNGYTFQNFDEQDGLADNTTFETIEDYKGRIWFVGMNNKLSYYENGRITPYPFNNAIQRLTATAVLSVKSSFYIDRNDNVYLSLKYIGIFKISPKGMLTRLDKIRDNDIAEFFQRDNKLLVAQHHGTINKLVIHTKDIHVSVVDNILSKAVNKDLFAVPSSDHKSIFVACDQYLLQIYKNGHYQIRDIGERIIWLSKDKDNKLWVCPFNGGAIALNENNLMGRIAYKYLEDKSVSSILQDKEGGFWFTTLDDGVFYLPSHSTYSYLYPDNLPDNEVLCVETGEKEFFIGTSNGFLSVIKDNKITNYPIDTALHSEITALSYDKIRKQLLIGSTYALYVFKDGKISPLINYHDQRNKKYEGSMITIKSMVKESGDTYWMGNSTGLSLVNVKQHTVLFYSSRDNTKKVIRISSLYRYPDGSLLIGSSIGPWLYKDKQFKRVEIIAGLNRRILKIAGDSKGRNIWIATKGGGLYLKTRDSIYHFTRKEGLLNNTPYELCLNKNELWMATSQGIGCITIKRYKPFQYSLHNFTVEDGLASNQVNQIKPFGNKILIATNEGLSILDRRKFKPTTVPIPVYITRVRLMMRDTVLPNNASLANKFNSISFSFVGISYQSLSKIRYQYRLLGLDQEWHTTQNTEVSFPFLPPGEYEFQVRTINDNGRITSQPVVQTFKIRPLFWQTGWFILIMTFSLLNLLYAIHRYRVKRIDQNNQIQQEINQYRQQALSKQMNPHFLFNSLNSIQSYIVKNDKVASSRYLVKFASLMRVVLNNSQSQAISLNDEMNALRLYLDLESMRFKDRFEYTIEIDPQINQITTLIPPFIIQPFIENSIWHGLMNKDGNGNLQIKLILDELLIRCFVEDNGVGRLKSAEIEGKHSFNRPSKGISITETRLRLFDPNNTRPNPIIYTDLYDQEGSPEGTRVEILIPILN